MSQSKTLDPLYYTARWDEILKKARRAANQKGVDEPNDVHEAEYALRLLGVEYFSVKTVLDQEGLWHVVWL